VVKSVYKFALPLSVAAKVTTTKLPVWIGGDKVTAAIAGLRENARPGDAPETGTVMGPDIAR
jgi:hypothetical protein